MKTVCKKLVLFSAVFALIFGALFAAFPRTAHAAGELTLNKPGLELSVGESDLLTADGGDVVWSSADENIATVSKSGVVKGISVGETSVTAEDSSGARATVPVYVIERERGFDENILISVFWPPTAEYMNAGEGDERWDEQYKLLADAHIDYLCNVTGRDRQQNIGSTPKQENTKETNLKMAYYAHKYGMRVSVADERFGTAFLNTDPVRITDIISEYSNVPGVGGYYILDEPFDPMPYADVYEAIKLADPTGYAHLNFQPIHAYGSPIGTLDERADERYREVLREWLLAGEEAGFPHEYLMFDFYPFTDTQGGMARDIYFANLNAVREVGLEFGVKTANYLQSISSVLQASGALSFRSASPEEIRYEAMTSLAYGYKQLSYFTWFLPTNRNGENFSQSIVDENGVPNPKYYAPITQLNAEIHALGKTLIGLNATEVYLNGTQWGWQEAIPAGFPVQPKDGTDFTVSLLEDATGKRRYAMVVNNDFSAPAEIPLTFGEEVKTLRRVSPETGEPEPVALGDDGSLVLKLGAGDGALFALFADESGSENPENPENPSDSQNPAPDKTEGDEKGCGSVVLGGGIAISVGVLSAAAAVICAVRKKEN